MTRSRLRWLLVPLLILPLSWLLFTGLGRDPADIPSPLVGRQMPAFTATTVDGTDLDSATLAGQPIVVNFWASWCRPCIAEHAVLSAAADDGVRLVGIVYQDSVEGARAFRQRYGGDWPDALDPTGAIAVDFGVTGPPETFFVDGQGIVRARHIGPLTPEAMAGLLAEIGVDR
jgi:cytochrome c biogenesis protein CcmG/thiol:disulfide interchange protein DsbE